MQKSFSRPFSEGTSKSKRFHEKWSRSAKKMSSFGNIFGTLEIDYEIFHNFTFFLLGVAFFGGYAKNLGSFMKKDRVLAKKMSTCGTIFGTLEIDYEIFHNFTQFFLHFVEAIWHIFGDSIFNLFSNILGPKLQSRASALQYILKGFTYETLRWGPKNLKKAVSHS